MDPDRIDELCDHWEALCRASPEPAFERHAAPLVAQLESPEARSELMAELVAIDLERKLRGLPALGPARARCCWDYWGSLGGPLVEEATIRLARADFLLRQQYSPVPLTIEQAVVESPLADSGARSLLRSRLHEVLRREFPVRLRFFRDRQPIGALPFSGGAELGRQRVDEPPPLGELFSEGPDGPLQRIIVAATREIHIARQQLRIDRLDRSRVRLTNISTLVIQRDHGEAVAPGDSVELEIPALAAFGPYAVRVEQARGK